MTPANFNQPFASLFKCTCFSDVPMQKNMHKGNLLPSATSGYYKYWNKLDMFHSSANVLFRIRTYCLLWFHRAMQVQRIQSGCKFIIKNNPVSLLIIMNSFHILEQTYSSALNVVRILRSSWWVINLYNLTLYLSATLLYSLCRATSPDVLWVSENYICGCHALLRRYLRIMPLRTP